MKVSLFQVQPLSLPNVATNNKPKVELGSFASFLKENLNKTNELQIEADVLTQRMAVGDDVELHEVMIATEKAELAMQLTLQIRNKLIEAYQEISKMQI
ncbi:MAG: flagellar hook-basal body protein FliE [Desulfitibacter sp. BRH_c19]|nr:MAG: flagellar hook-basal body protein FliE [Desulfitibacter sp. BRH_c19]